MRNTVKARVLNGVADQPQTCSQTCSMTAPGGRAATQRKLSCRPGKLNVALPTEAV